LEDLEKPAGELVLEMEILEVDKNYARQIGITPPQATKIFTLSPQQVQQAQQSLTGLVDVIGALFGLPSSLSGLTSTQVASLLSSGQLAAGTLVPPLGSGRLGEFLPDAFARAAWAKDPASRAGRAGCHFFRRQSYSRFSDEFFLQPGRKRVERSGSEQCQFPDHELCDRGGSHVCGNRQPSQQQHRRLNRL
jgi:hypothetical protein